MRLPTSGLVVLLLLHILPFVGRPALIGGDEPHYALMAHSIAVDGDLELENNYVEVENGSSAAGSRQRGTKLDRHVAEFGDRTVFTHPLGLPLLVAPLLWLQNLVVPGAAPDMVLGFFGLGVTFLALLEGLRLLAKWTPDRRIGLLVGLVVYFGTPLWFYSRTFFTEPYLWSGLVLSVGLLDRDRPMFASLVLGVTLLIKETALLAIVPILLWAWWRWGVLGFLRVSVFPVLALLLFGLKNLWVYGEWWVTFQPFQLGTPWWSGFVGLLFDSQHGLIPFAPIALVALLAWALSRGSWDRPSVVASAFALLAWVGYFIVSALWVDWRGGSGYGPRLLIPVLPALALPLATLAEDDRFPVAGWILAGAIAVLGFAVQWSAVTNPFGAFWSMPWRELVIGRPVPFLAGLSVGALFLWRYLRPAAGREGAAGGTLS
jgi:hypothetical protein